MSEIIWTVIWGIVAFGLLMFSLMLAVACLVRAYEKDVARVVARIKGEE